MKLGKDHPAWLHKAMADGGRVRRAPGGPVHLDVDAPVEQAGVLDSVARGAMRLLRRPKGKMPEPRDARQKTFDAARAEGKSFSEANDAAFPEGVTARKAAQDRLKSAVDANTEAARTGKPYPSDEWKGLFPEGKAAGGKVARRRRK